MKYVKLFVVVCLLLFALIINAGKDISNDNMEMTLNNMLSIANASTESRCINSLDAYCKNNPTLNTGYCVVEPTRICCKESTTHTKDCYDVGY